MKRVIFVLIFVVLAVTAMAENIAITSITPSSGPVSGGTVVTITGSGIYPPCIICSPPTLPPIVYFGRVLAKNLTFFSGEEVVVEAPPHLPATVAVTLIQNDGSSSDTLDDAFTFEGVPEDGFEPILLPVYVPPLPGGFGSWFMTSLNGWNESESSATIFGLDFTCMMPICLPMDPLDAAVELKFAQELADIPTFQIPTGTPGRFLWVNEQAEDHVTLQLRAWDTSRSATNFGTQVPIARKDDFRPVITLLDVPLDARFRKTLRIYGHQQSALPIRVAIEGHTSHVVTLQPGSNIFEPAYAEFTDFPAGLGTVRVQVTSDRVVEPLTPPEEIWAFISVTNNETQHITVISPQ